MGFGHGEHACPGRFFASNEMKIALCVLLLKYDLRFVPGEARPPDFMFETATVTHAKTKVQIRRREEELDLRKLRQ
jgi:cytochrome P450